MSSSISSPPAEICAEPDTGGREPSFREVTEVTVAAGIAVVSERATDDVASVTAVVGVVTECPVDCN